MKRMLSSAFLCRSIASEMTSAGNTPVEVFCRLFTIVSDVEKPSHRQLETVELRTQIPVEMLARGSVCWSVSRIGHTEIAYAHGGLIVDLELQYVQVWYSW